MPSDDEAQYDRRIRSHEKIGCTAICASVRLAPLSYRWCCQYYLQLASFHLCMEMGVFCPVQMVACTGQVCQQGESDTFANQTKLIKMFEELPKLSEQPFVVMAAFIDWPYCNIVPNWTVVKNIPWSW